MLESVAIFSVPSVSATSGLWSAAMALCALGSLSLSPVVFKYPAIRSLRDDCHRERIVALTYDDGPSSTLTPEIADVLGEAGVRATFFLVGSQIPGREALVDRLAAEGHELGCHTLSHRHAWKTPPWRTVADISDGYDALARWVPSDGIFRPPYGKLVLNSWLHVRRRRAPFVWWTHDSGDTFRHLPPATKVAERIQRDQGGIVLLHDSDRSNPAHRRFVLEATRTLLSVGRAEGLRFLPAGDVVRAVTKPALT